MNRMRVKKRALARMLRHGRHQLPLSEALKAGLICAVPALLAAALHTPLLCWAAIAAFWTCLADETAARRSARAARGAAFGALGALLCAGAIGVAGMPWLAIALTGAVVCAGALARSAGAAAGLRALLLVTAWSVAVSFPVHAGPGPLAYGIFFLGGSLWAVACSVGLWQYGDADRVRRSTFSFLYAASSFTHALADAAQGGPLRQGPGRALLRARLDTMIRVVDGAPLPAQAAGGVWPDRAERLIALLAGLDSLVAGQRRRDCAAARLLGPPLVALAEWLDACADATRRGEPSAGSRAGTQCALGTQIRYGLIRSQNEALSDEARGGLHSCEMLVSAMLALAEGRTPGSVRTRAKQNRLMPARPSATASLFGAVRDEVRNGGRIVRYALRLSIAAMTAVALARLMGVAQGYWIVLTTLFVVQPTVSQTVRVSSLRVWGTVLGASLASLVSLVFHNPILQALAIVPLATGTFAARGLSYVSYMLFLTPHFILVAHLGTPAGSPWLLAVLRIGNSLAGALVAVAVSLVARPEWERRKLKAVSNLAVAAVQSYLHVLRDHHAGAAIAPEALTAARRSACVAIDELDAVAAAVRLETVSSRHCIGCARNLAWHLRRLVGAASPIECVDAGVSEGDRRRLAAIGTRCIELLGRERPARRAELDATAPTVDATAPTAHPGAAFVRMIECRATESAAMANAMRLRVCARS